MQVARALEHRGGLGDAANLTLTFDRDVQDLQLDASITGALQPISARFEPRSGRFDVSFEIGNDSGISADTAALHRQRDRDRGSRRADAQHRTQ